MGKTYLQGEPLTAADLNASLSEAVNTSGYYVFAGIPAATAEYGYPFYTGEHIHNAKLTANNGFEVNTSPSFFYSTTNFTKNILVKEGGNITLDTGNITATLGSITDRIGNVRKVPINSVGSGYTLVALDSGKVVVNGSGGTLTVPFNVFTGGDTITIYNSGAAFTIVQGGGGTLYWAGQSSVTTGNRTLSTAGLCTVLFINSTYAVIAGAGLS